MEKEKPIIHVVVGIIYDAGKIFITRRPESSHLAGLWEFPGGKVEPGETEDITLKREVKEEVDIVPLRFEKIKMIHHTYVDRILALSFYLILEWDGMPFAKEGQESQWIECAQLDADQFPEANRPIIEKLRLGELHPSA